MPFCDGVYYPFTSDPRGARSSAGVPSLLNSPPSQRSASAAAMTPSSSVPPFTFRPRRDSVDWRRINAVDVDLVASQLDVDALQELMATVTFCSVGGERCPRCQNPVDPALVKLLQLAQLTVEWLLHCQDVLSLNLAAAEERLAAASRETQQLQEEQRRQEEKLKVLSGELKQRKKLIRTQQSLLAPRLLSSQKCRHCDKSFLNSSFLQNHMQRRHPDQYHTQLQSEEEKTSLIDRLKEEIRNLKEQMVSVQEKEQQSMQKEVQRELERFRTDELVRMDRKIEDSRDGIRREMESLYARNIQALNEVNQKPQDAVVCRPERDVYLQSVHQMETLMKEQEKKWESRLQDMNLQHEAEKKQLQNELSRMRGTMLDQEDYSQRLQQLERRLQEKERRLQLERRLQEKERRLQLERRLQDKEQTIRTQKEQILSISSNPPTKVVEAAVVVSAPVQEMKQKKGAHDCSSVSERTPAEKKPEPERRQRTDASALKRNPNVRKEMRPNVEHSVSKKLESLGVRSDQRGLNKTEFNSVLAKVQSKRESVAKTTPSYWRHREELVSMLEEKLGGLRGMDPALELQSRSKQAFQIRPRSSSLPARASRATSGPAVKQPKTPQPAPRTRTAIQPKTSTPNSAFRLTNKTPPFSSEEASEEEDTDSEDEEESLHQLKSRFNPASPVQIGAQHAGPVLTRQTAVRQSSTSETSAGGATRTAVATMESDEDEEEEWSEVSQLQEIDPKQLQSHKDLNGNVEKRNYGKGNRVSGLARRVEKQSAGREAKRPAGGISVLPGRKDEVQQLLEFTDLEDSSDWLVSSLEDKQEASVLGPLRRSVDSPGTSVWESSTGRNPRSGVTEAATGSSLKTSRLSLGDFSDSEDMDSKHT